MESELTPKLFVRSYWNYFIELEEQLISTRRFVDFDRANNKTFSIEYLKLLQATCGEIDVVAKILAECCDPDFRALKNKNIQKWGWVLQNAFSNIESMSVRFNNDYTLVPWHNWRYERYFDSKNRMQYRLLPGRESPNWWTAYNKVKHERTSQYEGQINYLRANLENLISAMAALFILENLLLSKLAGNGRMPPHENSKLFSLSDE